MANPRRNIPRALLGSILLTLPLFVIVMVAESNGLGASSAGAAFPQSLDEALSALERDPVLSTWLPADLLRTYLSVKRADLADVAQLSPDDLYARYAHAY